jgi:cystathionine beta-lyase
LGLYVSPDDCFLALRGLRTLAPRLDRHQSTGFALARWLEARPEVSRVLHPGLDSFPGHALWKRDFAGASGLFSFVVPADADVAAMVDGMALFGIGYSWGGYESLILPADMKTARSVAPWDQSEQILRVHAGLEDPDDLIADLEAGLSRL